MNAGFSSSWGKAVGGDNDCDTDCDHGPLHQLRNHGSAMLQDIPICGMEGQLCSTMVRNAKESNLDRSSRRFKSSAIVANVGLSVT